MENVSELHQVLPTSILRLSLGVLYPLWTIDVSVPLSSLTALSNPALCHGVTVVGVGRSCIMWSLEDLV